MTGVSYCDSNILLKRVLAESDHASVVELLAESVASGQTLIASQLAAVEVSRAISRTLDVDPASTQVARMLAIACSGVQFLPVNDDVLAVARALPGRHLGTLDALHVATAVLADAERFLTRDRRVIDVCREIGLPVG